MHYYCTRIALIGAACAALLACGDKQGDIRKVGVAPRPDATATPVIGDKQGDIRKVGVAQCPEPFKVVSCRDFSATGNSECVFENVAQQQLSGYPYAWAYTKDGVQIGKMPMMSVAGLLPGKKVQQHVLFNSDSVDRVVVCSVDPDDPLVKDRIAPI